jgi:hypothetical protein
VYTKRLNDERKASVNVADTSAPQALSKCLSCPSFEDQGEFVFSENQPSNIELVSVLD